MRAVRGDRRIGSKHLVVSLGLYKRIVVSRIHCSLELLWPFCKLPNRARPDRE
jgi:hypothetical protein